MTTSNDGSEIDTDGMGIIRKFYCVLWTLINADFS
jgi:hypothetical protein